MNPPASVVYSFVQAYECVINELCRHALNEVLPKRFFFLFFLFYYCKYTGNGSRGANDKKNVG